MEQVTTRNYTKKLYRGEEAISHNQAESLT